MDHSKLPRPNSRSKLSREPLGSSSRSLGGLGLDGWDGIHRSVWKKKKRVVPECMGGFLKWWYPKMDGENNGKPY